MVVTQGRRGSVLPGVIWHQNQLNSGCCCTCTASCEVHSVLDQAVSAVVLPITCNSNHGLQKFKGVSLTFSTHGLFGLVHIV